MALLWSKGVSRRRRRGFLVLVLDQTSRIPQLIYKSKPYWKVEHVSTYEAALKACAREPHDAYVLADALNRAPGNARENVLAVARMRWGCLPALILTQEGRAPYQKRGRLLTRLPGIPDIRSLSTFLEGAEIHGKRQQDQEYRLACERIIADVDPENRLTERQREVLRYRLLGVNRRGVSQRLEISPRTYDTHVEAIRRKLGISIKGLVRRMHNR
ncbi:MAG: LuxR C-terminal-related transcriptional regulator [Myxococcota bacterium]